MHDMFDQAFDFEVFFRTAICTLTGHWPERVDCSIAGSSTFSQTARIRTEEGLDFFIKCSEQVPFEAYRAESDGLRMLSRHTDMCVPEVIGSGTLEGRNFILMQYVGSVPTDTQYWTRLGSGLATLHAWSASDFGYQHSNYIGTLLQRNTWTSNFDTFFIEERLRIQAGLAVYEGRMDPSLLARFESLYRRVESGFFPKERPSLLHGDLWSGNVWCAAGQLPVLADPAVHYGHREFELAFTMLFGGFEPTFYTAYEEVFPLAPDFDQRVPAYHLYPLLVHLNMFGANYLPLIVRNLTKLGC